MEPVWKKALDLLAADIDKNAKHLVANDLAKAAELFAKMIEQHDLVEEPGDISEYMMQKHGVAADFANDTQNIYYIVDTLVTGSGTSFFWADRVP